MIRKVLVTLVVTSMMLAAPALAQFDRHQNASLNGYSGMANPAQMEQPTAFHTLAQGERSTRTEAAGSDNPSLESFNPNAVNLQPSRFGTSPSVAEHPDFDWIDQADVGA